MKHKPAHRLPDLDALAQALEEEGEAEDSAAAPSDTAIESAALLETPPNAAPEIDLLRTQQRYALADLMDGKTHSEAACGAGVDRKTLYNWINKDPAFKSAMETWRQRITQDAQDRLAQATGVAAEVLGIAAATDYRAAAILLKGRGVLSTKRETPADNPLAQVLALPPTQRRAFELRLRELILSFREEPQTMEISPVTAKALTSNVPEDAAPASRTTASPGAPSASGGE